MSASKDIVASFRSQLRGFEAIVKTTDLLAFDYNISKRAESLVESGVRAGGAVCKEIGKAKGSEKVFTAKAQGADRFGSAPIHYALTMAIYELDRVVHYLELNQLDPALSGVRSAVRTVYDACYDLSLGLQKPFPTLEEFTERVAKLSEDTVERSL